MDDATKAVLLLAMGWMGKFARELIRDRRAKSERHEQRERLNKSLTQLDVRLDLVENRCMEALEHVASINRKEWRKAHPGMDTPQPDFEPRTNITSRKP